MASPGMMIPIGAMSLSSRYETPRSGILSLADEEEEEEEEEEGEGEGEDGMVSKKSEKDFLVDSDGQVIRVDHGEEEVEVVVKGLKMDVDVDV